jgi:hypothetical protein
MLNLFRHPTCSVSTIQANIQDVHQARRSSRGVLKRVQHDFMFLRVISLIYAPPIADYKIIRYTC